MLGGVWVVVGEWVDGRTRFSQFQKSGRVGLVQRKSNSPGVIALIYALGKLLISAHSPWALKAQGFLPPVRPEYTIPGVSNRFV